MRKIRGELLLAAGAVLVIGTIGAADMGGIGAVQIVLQTLLGLWLLVMGLNNTLNRLCRSYGRSER